MRVTTGMLCFVGASLIAQDAYAQGESGGYDDPAVAVCEFVLFEGESRPDSFKRVAAEVSGLRVGLAYEVSILNTKPKRIDRSCEFERNKDGNFEIVRKTTPEAIKCGEEIEVWKNMDVGSLSKAEAEKYANRSRQCERILRAELGKMGTFITLWAALRQLGLSPISPEDTALQEE